MGKHDSLHQESGQPAANSVFDFIGAALTMLMPGERQPAAPLRCHPVRPLWARPRHANLLPRHQVR